MSLSEPVSSESESALIQPRGALLVVDPVSFEILKASHNTDTLLGRAAETLLATNLADLVGTDTVDRFRRIFADTGTAANPTPVSVGEYAFDSIVHLSGGLGIIEFEPTLAATRTPSSAAVYGAFHRLSASTTSHQLWDAAAREVRTITGFDRVMIYQFDADGGGEVVADEHASDMISYQGWQYPATDISAETRNLYCQLRSRTIVDSGEAPVALVSLPGETLTADLGRAELRTPSAHHQRFMRTMGQASTLHFSLIHDGQLVGLITCAHRTPRWVPFSLRQGLEILANQLALHVNSMNTIETLSCVMRVRAVRAELLAQVQSCDDIAHSLTAGRLTVLSLIAGDGAVVSLGGVATATRAVPSFLQLSFVIDYLHRLGHTTAFVSDAMAREHPELAEIVPDVAGLLMIPLGASGFSDGNYLAWYRHETVRTVTWLGAKSDSNRQTPDVAEPGDTSWHETIRNTSVPWHGLVSEAVELGRDLDSALLTRVESKLADLALRDNLTGLPNRRLLMDRLEHALTKYARGDELALLYIDLDGIRALNDVAGHIAGDSAIRDAGIQIESSVRAQDTIARFDGDEFVVMCENTTNEEAMIVANRILAAIRTPLSVGGVTLTASIGLASARFSFSAFDLLGEAINAMERAKARGKNVVSL